MSSAPVEPRVGDRERSAVDGLLQAAVGDGVLTLAEYDERAALLWQARTRSELDALVADLPAAPPAAAAPQGGVRPQRVVAVMSEDRFAAAVAPGQPVEGWALMGKAVLDLRRADLPDGVRVRVRTLMGEAEVQVPPGSTVHLSGMAVMGERRVSVAPGRGPVVHVDAWAVMGSVKVTVGDGSVVPAAVPARRAAAVPAPAPRSSPARRLAQRASRLGVAGVLALGAVGVVASGTDARTVFGSTTERVDVRSADETVAVSVLFGSVTVVVPDDARVDTSGLVVFGSVDCEAACDAEGDGPLVEVRAVGGFGSVEVVTASEVAADARDDADEPDDD